MVAFLKATETRDVDWRLVPRQLLCPHRQPPPTPFELRSDVGLVRTPPAPRVGSGPQRVSGRGDKWLRRPTPHSAGAGLPARPVNRAGTHQGQSGTPRGARFPAVLRVSPEDGVLSLVSGALQPMAGIT